MSENPVMSWILEGPQQWRQLQMPVAHDPSFASSGTKVEMDQGGEEMKRITELLRSVSVP